MTWKPETAGQRKTAFGVATAIFAFTWVLLLIWAVQNFRFLTREGSFYLVLLLALYPVPWLQTVVERPKSAAMLTVTYLALAFAVLALRHMVIGR